MSSSNGFKNLVTVLVKADIDNGAFNDWMGRAGKVLDQLPEEDDHEDAVKRLAEVMRQDYYYHLRAQVPNEGLWYAFCRTAMAEVDWPEVAERLLERAKAVRV